MLKRRYAMGFLAGIALLVVFLAGCGGGGGNGNGNGGGGGDFDEQLLGLWQANDATRDGAPVALTTAMGWAPTWTRITVEFLEGGKCTQRGYQGSTLVSTRQGTWSAMNQNGTVTFDGDKTSFTYLVYWPDKLRADIEFARDGHQYKVRWVRLTNFTECDAEMAKHWKARRVLVDGTEVSLDSFFKFQSGSDTFTLQLLAGGTAIGRELKGSEQVDSWQGTWGARGGVFWLQQEGQSFRGISDQGGALTIFLDPSSGHTVRIEWDRWASDGTRPAGLQGKWRPTGLTQDGIPFPLGDYFHWDPGITTMELELWADGTAEVREYEGATLRHSRLGSWEGTGTSLTLRFEESITVNYTLTGSTVTVTQVADGHTYVLTLTHPS